MTFADSAAGRDSATPPRSPSGGPVSIATVFNDRDSLNKYLLNSIKNNDDGELDKSMMFISNESNSLTKNIAFLYNVILSAVGPDVVALVHPDVAFHERFASDIVASARKADEGWGGWGAMGIVGRGWDGRYVWCHEVREPTPVCCLDSCSLITRRSHGIRFDQVRFDEFHCYVEDYCLQCHARGLGVFVLPTRASHGSATMSVRGPQWGGYRKYRRRLGWKWKFQFKNIMTC